MKFGKIVLMDFNDETIDKSHFGILNQLAESVEIVCDRNLNKIKDADVLLTKITTLVDKELIDACQNLKYIGVFATSFSKVDTEYAKSKGIAVTNLAGYSTEAVAEFVFSVLLDYIRDLERGKENAKKSDFEFLSFLGWELKGKTIGIIGLGSIGKRVSEIAQGFGLNVIYWSRNRKLDYESKGIKYCELEEVLKKSDVITIHLAHNNETKGIINKEMLEKIKEGTILITLTSLELMDTNKLKELLKQGKLVLISDYLDLFPEEERKELQKLKNVVAFPPLAFRTREAIQGQKNLLIDNLVKFSEGKIQNKVN